jgi:glycosyltransferase involved in cell wall biosynthesis
VGKRIALTHAMIPRDGEERDEERRGRGGVASLFMLNLGTNAGYAISRLERIFFDVMLELAGGDPAQVHFSFTDLERGAPASLPEGFPNVTVFDIQDPKGRPSIANYVAKNRIRLVIPLDLQPVHPLYRELRRAGAYTIVPYWGAAISAPGPKWKVALKRLVLAASRSRVDGLIFESRAMADLAVHGRGVSEHMVDVVPLGIDLSLIPEDGSHHYVHETFGLPLDRRVIVYAGHMEERKGIRVLVEAAIELLSRRQRRDVCFLICGNRDGESERFERLYRGLGIDAWIRFAGYRSDLFQIYPSCFCGVIPSTGWDSFTYASVEMAGFGLPVVASRLQGLAEAVVDGETGLHFTPGDPAALADCLEVLLDHPERAHKLGGQGRRRCERELNVVIQREQLVAVLRQRLDVHARRRPGERV